MMNKKLVLGSVVAGVVLVAGLVVGIVAFNGKGNDEVATAPTEVTEVVTLTDEEKADFEDLKKKTIEEIEALNKESNEEVDIVVKAFVEKLNGIKVDDFTVYADLEKEVASVKEEAEKAVNNKVAELAAKAEEERLVAEEAARVEAERLAAEQAEAERLAAEEAAKAEQTASSSSSKKNSSSNKSNSSSSNSSNTASNIASASNDYVSDDDRLETEEEYMKRAEEAKKLQETVEANDAAGKYDDGKWVPAPPKLSEEEHQALEDEFWSY